MGDSSVTSSAGSEHEHPDPEGLHGAMEQAAMYLVAGLGISANALLVLAVLLQAHTRRLSSAFLVHACLLNTALSGYCVVFGKGLQAETVPVNSCNSLGTSYVVLMTASVFNLVATACCEVYLFDNCSSAVKKRPKGSLCCVLFGTVLVYTGSVILHLGPTLIGANFESSKSKRCLFVYGQAKNYIVFTMWILIVSLALAAATYYLAVFHKVIGKTVQAKLIILSSQQDELEVSMEAVDRKLDALAAIKRNRQRVLSAVCAMHFVCWYPLFLLILIDPQYQVSTELYKLLTILGFSRAALEPLVVLAFDRSANHILARFLPCTQPGLLSTEDDVNRWMLAVDAAAAARAGGPPASGNGGNGGSGGSLPGIADASGAASNASCGEQDDTAIPDLFEQQQQLQVQHRQLHHRYSRQSAAAAAADSLSVDQSSSMEGFPPFSLIPPPPPPPPQFYPPPPTVSSGRQLLPVAATGMHHQHHFPAVPFRQHAGYGRTLAYSPITRV